MENLITLVKPYLISELLYKLGLYTVLKTNILFLDLLPFYAILRSIPNKLLGVIAMFSAILILLLLSVTDVSRSRGMQFRPLCKILFFAFAANFLILMQLGSKHVESPFIELGQICTVLYFLYFSAAILGITNLENTVVDLKTEKKE